MSINITRAPVVPVPQPLGEIEEINIRTPNGAGVYLMPEGSSFKMVLCGPFYLPEDMRSLADGLNQAADAIEKSNA